MYRTKMWATRASALLLFFLFAMATAQAQTVLRGPYLQLQTTDGITIRWRTDSPTDSVVRYGTDPAALTETASVAFSTTEHTVRLSGLAGNQQYWYSVGTSSGPLAGDSSHHFFTAPPQGVAADTRVWVIGDSGTANANADAVYNAFRTWSASDPADFWLMLGDNAYNSGTDGEYQAAVFETYPEFLRQLPLWPTLGNHDAGSASSNPPSGVYYDIFDLPASGEAGGWPSGTEAYYSFDYANIHFICLNSQDVSRAANGTMMQWLQMDLIDNTQPWVIAFWHHPPYTKGSHDSDTESRLVDMRQVALPVLEAWGVDLVMTGHSHSYERSFLLDGHYGLSTDLIPAAHILDPGDGRETGDGAYEKPDVIAAEHAGAVYAVAGSSGKISGGSLDHPAMFVSLNELGSLVLDVSGNRMDVTFLDNLGAVRDTFTITKTPDADPPLITGASATDATHVLVDFNENLDPATASDAFNYAIAGLSVSQAELQADGRSVLLTTSEMTDGASYVLVVNHLQDLAGNTIAADSSVGFDFFQTMTLAFQDGMAPGNGYAGTRDGYIRQATPTNNYGSATTLQVDGDDPGGSGNDMNILLSWDVSSIPADAVVLDAHIELEVTNPSSGVYDCRALLRSWTESEATWNQAAAGSTWGSAGASGASDRGTDVLCSVVASATGPLMVNLTQAGLDRVQAWVTDPTNNHGLIISNGAPADGADFHSRESSTAIARPRLEITYRVPTSSGNNDPVASFNDSCNYLDCVFTDTSSDSDGSVIAWSWDFGDGFTSTAQNPLHAYAAAGDYTVSLTVTDNEGATGQDSAIISVAEPPQLIDQFAVADLGGSGSVSGSYTDTHDDDGVFQSITERESGGRKRDRHSLLAHTWQFSVAAGSPITVYANAWSSGSTDGDAFAFEWSTDNANFQPLFTVTSTSDANMESADITSGGTVYIRVTDTDQTPGNRTLDTVYIDQLYIRSFNAEPPTIPEAPTGLAVSNPTSSTLDLGWSHPTENETSFDLERAPASTGPWTAAGSPAGGTEGYTDTGLAGDTIYYYRLRARNSAGASDWSNTASGATTTAPLIQLSASGSKQRGAHVVDLSWSGTGTQPVDIVRDNNIIDTVTGSGYRDATGNKGGATYVYRVCLAGTDTCSNDVTVVF